MSEKPPVNIYNTVYLEGWEAARERCVQIAEEMEPLGYERIAAALRELKPPKP